MPIDKTKADRLIEVYNFLTGLVEGKRDVEPLQLKDGTILYRDEVGQSAVDTIPVEEAAAAPDDVPNDSASVPNSDEGAVDTIPVEEAEAAAAAADAVPNDSASVPNSDESAVEPVGPEMINLVEATETQQNGASRRRRNGKSTRARRGTRKQRRNRK